MGDFNDFRGGFRGRGRGAYRGRGDPRGGYGYRGGGTGPGSYRGGPNRGRSGGGAYGHQSYHNSHYPYNSSSGHRGNYYGQNSGYSGGYSKQGFKRDHQQDHSEPADHSQSSSPRDSYQLYRPTYTNQAPGVVSTGASKAGPTNEVIEYLNITDKALQKKLNRYDELSGEAIKLGNQRFKALNQYQVLKIQLEKDQLNVDINHEKLQEMSFM